MTGLRGPILQLTMILRSVNFLLAFANKEGFQ